jgi:hypothetical protein
MTRNSDNQAERAPCEDVAERVALGEPLGELAGHAASCGECRSITAVADKLAATHHAIDPGLGFSARMTIGAQQLLAVRRRRRMAMSLAGLTCAGAFGVFVMTRAPKEPEVALGPVDGPQHRQLLETPQPVADQDARMLIELADTRRASRASAAWGRIEKPLRPYMRLVRDLREAPTVMHDPATPDPEPTEPSEDTP